MINVKEKSSPDLDVARHALYAHISILKEQISQLAEEARAKKVEMENIELFIKASNEEIDLCRKALDKLSK